MYFSVRRSLCDPESQERTIAVSIAVEYDPWVVMGWIRIQAMVPGTLGKFGRSDVSCLFRFVPVGVVDPPGRRSCCRIVFRFIGIGRRVQAQPHLVSIRGVIAAAMCF